MLKEKLFLFSLFLLVTCCSIAQNDTSSTHGTIKIGKPKDGKIHIKVYMRIDNYDVSKVNGKVSRNMVYEPFPGVEGYTFPFNYTKFFTEKFKDKKNDLRGKDTDTVCIEIRVLANRKIYIKDRTPARMVKDLPSAAGEKVERIEWNSLQINSLNFLKEIKTWEPAYVAIPKKGKFKKQTVIKPDITYIPFSQTLTIVFSSTPFEE